MCPGKRQNQCVAKISEFGVDNKQTGRYNYTNWSVNPPGHETKETENENANAYQHHRNNPDGQRNQR
jgi:hypothetical protein